MSAGVDALPVDRPAPGSRPRPVTVAGSGGGGGVRSMWTDCVAATRACRRCPSRRARRPSGSNCSAVAACSPGWREVRRAADAAVERRVDPRPVYVLSMRASVGMGTVSRPALRKAVSVWLLSSRQRASRRLVSCSRSRSRTRCCPAVDSVALGEAAVGQRDVDEDRRVAVAARLVEEAGDVEVGEVRPRIVLNADEEVLRREGRRVRARVELRRRGPGREQERGGGGEGKAMGEGDGRIAAPHLTARAVPAKPCGPPSWVSRGDRPAGRARMAGPRVRIANLAASSATIFSSASWPPKRAAA